MLCDPVTNYDGLLKWTGKHKLNRVKIKETYTFAYQDLVCA